MIISFSALQRPRMVEKISSLLSFDLDCENLASSTTTILTEAAHLAGVRKKRPLVNVMAKPGLTKSAPRQDGNSEVTHDSWSRTLLTRNVSNNSGD